MSNTKKIKIDTTNKVDETAEEIKIVKEVDGTPFSCVKYDEKYFLALGKYRLSDLMNTEEEVFEDAKDVSWWRMLAVIHAVAQEVVLNSQKDDK